RVEVKWVVTLVQARFVVGPLVGLSHVPFSIRSWPDWPELSPCRLQKTPMMSLSKGPRALRYLSEARRCCSFKDCDYSMLQRSDQSVNRSSAFSNMSLIRQRKGSLIPVNHDEALLIQV
ncbi:8332_t:CDS:2, partial [Scutellospora calospora]